MIATKLLKVNKIALIAIRTCHQPSSSTPPKNPLNPTLKDFMKSEAQLKKPLEMPKSCGDKNEEDDLSEEEEMFVKGPVDGKMEWNGPTRGGRRPEPTVCLFL